MAERVSTAQAAGEVPSVATEPMGNPYPWGLRLNLSGEQLEQFGIETPEAGDTFEVDAVGVVVRCSSEDPDADGDVDYINVEIQLTEMALAKTGESAGEDGDAADTMYGKKE